MPLSDRNRQFPHQVSAGVKATQGQGLTSGGAVALVADLPQAVQALVDTPQSVFQLTVLAAQGLALDVVHVRRTEEVLITFCGVKRHRMSDKDFPCRPGVLVAKMALSPTTGHASATLNAC